MMQRGHRREKSARIVFGAFARAWWHRAEDYAFCRRWRDIGGMIRVDLDCKLMHLGQHMFRGDLAESLRVQGRW